MQPQPLKPGDRVRVYQWVPPNADDYLLTQQWLANPWMGPLDPAWKKLPCWPTWPIVVLRSPREGGWVPVTSIEFPEPLRSQGVPVPVSNCELLQEDYGLPELAIAPVPAKRSKRKQPLETFEQRALL